MFRPMRATFLPCLPTRGAIVPATPVWLHEIKYDGYRLIVQRDGRPIVSQELFARAQARLLEVEHGRKITDKEILDRLAALWQRKGHLSVKIIQAAKNIPNCTVYATRFGSLMNAYKRIGFEPKPRYQYVATGAKIDNIICSATDATISDMERSAGVATFLHELYLLTINGNLTIVVVVAWSVSDGMIGGKRARRWEVRKIKYRKSDLTLVIRMGASRAFP
jgi:hypothetical protein